MPTEKLAHAPPVPRESLPTMYDLPSEDPEEPGLPDEFHYFQPQLLRETFRPPAVPTDRYFVATDLNLYYDVEHTNRYKRPDWFAVLDHTRLYEQRDLRLSYVIWQEQVAPYLVVELLSPGTEKEDLGQVQHGADGIPGKWEVYERWLRVPYYVVFSRYTDELQCFVLDGDRYQRRSVEDGYLWLDKAQLGLGLWTGAYQGIQRRWLRFCDVQGNWIATPTEQEQQRAEQEHQRAEQERQRAERLAAQLKALGIDPDLPSQ